jgi:hypothetical protein
MAHDLITRLTAASIRRWRSFLAAAVVVTVAGFWFASDGRAIGDGRGGFDLHPGSGRRPRGLGEPSPGQERGQGPGVDPERESHAGRPELAPGDERVHGRAAHLQLRGDFGGREPLALGLQWCPLDALMVRPVRRGRSSAGRW